MKGFAFSIALLSLAWAALAARGAAAQDATQVHAQGCVAAGVEASCLVVKDAASGKVFSLVIRGIKPAIGIGIDFTGAPYNGATTCMQGIPVQVTAWTRKNSLNCPKSHVKSVD